MALIDQIDKIACGLGDAGNTGHQACPIDWDMVKTVKLTKKGVPYPDEEDNLVNVKKAQQKGDVIIINNIDSFVLVPQEVVIDTTEGSGKKTVSGELPYEYNLMFKAQGINFWKAMRSLDSQGIYDVAFYDVEGNEFFTKTKMGVSKGFGSYMIKTGQYKGKEGNTPASFMTTIQLSDYKEMERMAYISSDELDYSAQSDLDGINGVNLVSSPLVVGGTSLVVSTLLIDNTHFVDGLLVADFRVKKDGAVITPTAVVGDSSAKNYTFTIATATAGTYTVELYDSVLSANAIQTAQGLIFKSNIATVVVA
jgi:hypothetical protein